MQDIRKTLESDKERLMQLAQSQRLQWAVMPLLCFEGIEGTGYILGEYYYLPLRFKRNPNQMIPGTKPERYDTDMRIFLDRMYGKCPFMISPHTEIEAILATKHL